MDESSLWIHNPPEWLMTAMLEFYLQGYIVTCPISKIQLSTIVGAGKQGNGPADRAFHEHCHQSRHFCDFTSMVANNVVSFFEPVESICGEDTQKQVINYIANRERQQPKIVADAIEGQVCKQLRGRSWAEISLNNGVVDHTKQQVLLSRSVQGLRPSCLQALEQGVVHPITGIVFLPIEYDTLHTDHKHLNGKFRGFLPTSQNRHLGTFERLAEKLSPGPTLDEETAKALAEATLRHIREISPTAAFIREMVSRHPKQCAAFQCHELPLSTCHMANTFHPIPYRSTSFHFIPSHSILSQTYFTHNTCRRYSAFISTTFTRRMSIHASSTINGSLHTHL
ncbi:hypothetical protein FIBSPDRAFT_968023 [Athelia psychrophila]|uniref:Uncharacterized protein n=1 Tax=Athelia psychrophila TaxID=1759441 RepID=A0A167V293_9AGAM|nr:hypothetical protein FIBSPDRAFT_968023 [Fibularhizoctonia sp. CBS 109695]